MKTTLYTLMAICATATTALVYAGTSPSSTSANCADDSHYPLITRTDLKQHVNAKDALIIDVNSADSYHELHVPTAIHFANHKADLAKVLPAKKDALIVAYCGGPQCEAWLQAAQQACELGYTNIQHFKEGITGWKKGV